MSRKLILLLISLGFWSLCIGGWHQFLALLLGFRLLYSAHGRLASEAGQIQALKWVVFLSLASSLFMSPVFPAANKPERVLAGLILS